VKTVSLTNLLKFIYRFHKLVVYIAMYMAAGFLLSERIITSLFSQIYNCRSENREYTQPNYINNRTFNLAFTAPELLLERTFLNIGFFSRLILPNTTIFEMSGECWKLRLFNEEPNHYTCQRTPSPNCTT